MKLNYLHIALIIISIFFLPQFIKASTDECMSCHSDLGDEYQVPADSYKNDIHYLKGITCAGCHGGDASNEDMDEAMDKSKGFIGVPKRAERYKVCIKCHADANKMKKFGSNIPTDQYEKVKESVHFQSSYDNKGPIADCVTCHSIHNIAAVDNPRAKVYPTNVVKLCGSCHSSAEFMKKYDPSLPVDQVAKYKTSVHGKKNAMGDPNVAECASCHGHHDIFPVKDSRSHVYPTNIPKTCSNCHSDSKLMSKYNLPTDQYDSYVKSVHGKALLEKGDLSAPACNSCHGNHGAVPPGVESISKVCGTCHVQNMDLFEQSPHKKAFDEENLPECETCHSNHLIEQPTDEMLGVSDNAVCSDCHSEDDKDKGYFTAKQMRLLIDSLKTEDDTTKIILEDATQKGMDVSDAVFMLKDVRQNLIQTRTSVHAFNLEIFDSTISSGFKIIKKAKSEGLAAVDDYYFRREGLGIATIIVTLLVIGLYFKIRKMEKKET